MLLVQAMGIQRYIFMSIFNCEKHPEVPLMNIKSCTEKFLASTGVPYTVLRLTGFHQVSQHTHTHTHTQMCPALSMAAQTHS